MDRRVLAAIVLMMVIAILPAVLLRRPPRPVGGDSARVAPRAQAPLPPPPPPPIALPLDTLAASPARVIRVTSPLYTYAISTRGGLLAEATLHRYRSMAPGERGDTLQILPPASDLLGLRVVAGGDTLQLREWDFSPSVDTLVVTAGGGPLTLTAARGNVGVTIQYRFEPDEYRIMVDGQITGIGPNGGALLVGLGPGLRNTESDSIDHQRNLGVVTKARGETDLTRYSSLDYGQVTELSGPFEWVAVKSKYFVTALFAIDTLETTYVGRLAGVRARPLEERKQLAQAEVLASLPVPAAGTFRFTLYAGPMEYPRLRGMGHDFYDVNPYGWPGLRTIIRPVAVAARWLLVVMHDALGIAYGLGLVLFGILVRVVLWPLNQKAMRASMQMQAIQPLVKDVQARYKDDPQRVQQEMFKLYKEYKVNPFGGCWPMLLPMPVLFALFFVFQNTIELRGAPFLWLVDLSRPDPYYVIPVLMGLSMYLVSKIGQMGMEANPQMKMMLYVMPAMMTVLFLNFPSGLNLYYAVQNLASIPQQFLLAKERQKVNPRPPAAPPPSLAPAKSSGKKR
ncbi:MAG TPA: membrane protein insertase YidC [Gemmatimonadales bacterium]